MALAITNGGLATKTTGTTLNVSYPASIAVGDLLLLHITTEASITTPDGWTDVQSNTNTGMIAKVCSKIADSGDVSAGTIAITTSNNAGAGSMFRITGHDASSPIGASNKGTGSSSPITVSTITPAKVSSLIIMFIAGNTNGAETTSGYATANDNPTFTEVYDSQWDGNSFQASAAYALRLEGSATGNITATATDNYPYVAIVLAISPADQSYTATPAAQALVLTQAVHSVVASTTVAPAALSMSMSQSAPTTQPFSSTQASNTPKNTASASNAEKHIASAANETKHQGSVTNLDKSQ